MSRNEVDGSISTKIHFSFINEQGASIKPEFRKVFCIGGITKCMPKGLIAAYLEMFN